MRTLNKLTTTGKRMPSRTKINNAIRSKPLTAKQSIKRHGHKTVKNGATGAIIGCNPEIKLNLYGILDKIYSNINIDDKYETHLRYLLNYTENIKSKYVQYKTNLCVINLNINSAKNIYSFDIANKKYLPRDSRIDGIFTAFNNLIRWIKSVGAVKLGLGNVIINTAVFIWISDRFIWDIKDIDRNMPICLYACPRDMNYIIIPDTTFLIQSVVKRYAAHGLNWEQQKRLFKTDIQHKNKIFFRGADTTTTIHNLRGYIYDRLKTEQDKTFKKDIIYEFLTGQNYESVAAFKKYKFMLNLPGHYPWSTRLKYLYLGRQYIINVRVFTHLDDGTIEDHYHSFVDLVVPDKHCINIDMKFYYSDSSEADKVASAANKNKQECEKVYQTIKDIYYSHRNKQPSADKTVLDAYKLINQLSSADINNYYLQIALRNNKLGIRTVDIKKYYGS